MPNLEKFELDKYYRHYTGKEIHICGLADTILWRITYISESSGDHKLSPVAMNDSDATIGWIEITKQEFLKKIQ